MKILHIFIILLIFSISNIYPKSEADKTGKIIINGTTSDFDAEADQILLSPDLSGRNHESESDSRWGSYNDIASIKVTWDAKNLFIGSDAIINGNNIIIYLDSGQSLGVSGAGSLISWKRKIIFENIKPDFFMASWDNNVFPQFWKIESPSGVTEKTFEISTSSFFNGAVKGSIESKIPWETLYGLGEGRVLPAAVLKITGVVTGGDNSSSPDSAPDTTEELPLSSDITATIDNYLIIPIDSDANGYPDMNINIRDVASVAVDTTSLKYQQLQIKDLRVKDRSFTPDNDGINDELDITYFITKDAKVSVRIFNIAGDLIHTYQKEAELTAGFQMIRWNGYNDSNIISRPGLYLVHIEAKASGVSVVRKIGAYLVN
ncbi:MAG: gliding motility-associated C-terminal domain-containing protein [Spirochaetes bacterium]|nr:gliding motility-associated C-terminal domain-containing protein [Spirochaetota bacterium]